MKIAVTALIYLFLLTYPMIASAQAKPAKEKAPTQKELQDMMKEMQRALDDISEEDKKEMEKNGIKMPDIKGMQRNISGVTDRQLKKAFDDDNRIVPKRDDSRISKALSVQLNNTGIDAYTRRTHEAVLAKLSPGAKSKGFSILQQVRAAKQSAAATAVGLWIEGKPTLALYLMGEALIEDAGNVVNLNNYAAFLSMCGAEQIALPILNNLNKRYPKNSSILNNLTQAWLGLGDTERAAKYVDSTLRIAPFHPQANMAKCLVEESRGNIPAAIEAAKKSISKSFSVQKQTKLAKLGYTLKSTDLNWDRPQPADPMNLDNFTWPGYPGNVEQSKSLEREWDLFKDQCKARLDELHHKEEKAEQDLESINQKRLELLLQAAQNGQGILPVPAYSFKASAKLSYLLSPYEIPVMSFVFPIELEPVVAAGLSLSKLDDVLEAEEAAINNKYEDLFGEGKPNPFEAACNDINNVRNNYLQAANSMLENVNKTYINAFRRQASNHLYYCQYTMWPEQFELAKINAQISWLTFISTQKVVFKNKSGWCQDVVVKKDKTDSLANFDDVSCQYVSTMNLGIYSITSRCSQLIGTFDFGGVKIDITDNIETNRMNGTVIVGVSKGFDGPAGTELEMTAGALIEFDNSGVTDVGVIAGAVGNVAGQTVVGAEATLTVNSGTSVSGKGILDGIKF